MKNIIQICGVGLLVNDVNGSLIRYASNYTDQVDMFDMVGRGRLLKKRGRL